MTSQKDFTALGLFLSYLSLTIQNLELIQSVENLEIAAQERSRILPVIKMIYEDRISWIEKLSKYSILCAFGANAVFYLQWTMKSIKVILSEGFLSKKLRLVLPVA